MLFSVFSSPERGTPSRGAMGYPALVFILGGFGVYVGPLGARALDGLVGLREA